MVYPWIWLCSGAVWDHFELALRVSVNGNNACSAAGSREEGFEFDEGEHSSPSPSELSNY